MIRRELGVDDFDAVDNALQRSKWPPFVLRLGSALFLDVGLAVGRQYFEARIDQVAQTLLHLGAGALQHRVDEDAARDARVAPRR